MPPTSLMRRVEPTSHIFSVSPTSDCRLWPTTRQAGFPAVGWGIGSRDRLRAATLASRTQVKGLASDECIRALVGGQPHEPVDAAGASQPLELVLACVF